MKIHPKIKMLGYEWKIKYTNLPRKEAGGNFEWKTKTITINDKFGEAQTIFLHEVIEAILVHNLTRYYGNEGNTEYHFFFNHTAFTKIVSDISQVLKDNGLMKLK